MNMSHGLKQQLNEKLRDAQLSFYLHEVDPAGGKPPTDNTLLPGRTADELYAHWLLDVQISQSVPTSRVACATESLQQYINSISLGVEPGYDIQGMTPKQIHTWENSLYSYSVWHASQQLRHFPSNYLSPALRQNKSDIFQQLENDINQSRLQQSHIDTAVQRYLGRLEEIINLHTINGYIDGTAENMADSTYYLIAKSKGSNTYYYRSLNMRSPAYSTTTEQAAQDSLNYPAPGAWSDWMDVPLPASEDIPLQSIRPVCFNNRLFVIWAQCTKPQFSHQELPALIGEIDYKNPDRLLRFGRYYTRLRLHYSYKKLDGSWSCPQVCIDENCTSKSLNALTPQDLMSSIRTVAVLNSKTTPATLFLGLASHFDAQNQPLHANHRTNGANFNFSHAVQMDSQFNISPLVSSGSLSSLVRFFPSYLAVDANRYLITFAKHNEENLQFHAPASDIVSFKAHNLTSPHVTADRWNYNGTQDHINNTPERIGLTFNKTTSTLEISSSLDTSFPSIKTVTLHTEEAASSLTITLAVEVPQNGGASRIALYKNSSLSLRHTDSESVFNERLTLSITCNKTKIAFPDIITHLQKKESSSITERVSNLSYNGNAFEAYDLEDLTIPAIFFNHLFATEDTTYSAKLSFSSDQTHQPIHFKALRIKRSNRTYRQIILTPHQVESSSHYPRHVHITNTHLVGGPNGMRRNLEGGLTSLTAGQIHTAQLSIDPYMLMQTDTLNIHIFHGVLIREQNIDDSDSIILGYALKAFEVTLNARARSDIPMGPKISRLASTDNGTAEFLDFSTSSIPKSDPSNSLNLPFIRLNTGLADKLTRAANVDMASVFSLSNLPLMDPSLPPGGPHKPADFHGAYGKYLWELFLYLPWLITHRLHTEHRYAEAESWLKYLFDPSRNQPTAAHTQAYWGLTALTPAYSEPRYARDNPLDPNQIALSAPVYFRQALFLLYVDIFLNRGDAAYRQMTAESLSEAKLWYVRAKRLLGPLPEISKIEPWSTITLATLASRPDSALRETERMALQPDSGVPPLARDTLGAQHYMPLDTPDLCAPINKDLLMRWKKIDARLHNLRQHLDITGKPLHIPLYVAPLAPRGLLALYSQGHMTGSTSNRTRQPVHVGHYRFHVIYAQAMAAVDNLILFGNSLLSMIERQEQAAQVDLQHQHVWQLAAHALEHHAHSVRVDEQNQLSLLAGQRIVEARITHFERLLKERISSAEHVATQELQTSASLESVAFGLQAAAGLAIIPPNIFGTSNGGWRLEGGFYAVQAGVQLLANEKRANANHLDRNELFNRRAQEWEHALDQSRLELSQVKAQVQAYAEQSNSTRLQLQSTATALSQAKIAYDLLNKRFTAPQMYQWLSAQLSTFYLQAYDAALALCLDAQACWQYERAESSRTFIHTANWNNHHRGFTAGETLKLSLITMHTAYLQHNQRALEITKTVSLRHLQAKDTSATLNMSWPEISASLKTRGTVAFELTQAMFDADYPGHYLRRIKSISVSLPATLSPYEDIRATLTQTYSTIQTSQNADFAYPNLRVREQIALSTGLNDNGLFTLNFEGDDRYLPFEYTGAVSRWILSFPNPAAQQSMLDSLSDVIVHVRYTAKSAGERV